MRPLATVSLVASLTSAQVVQWDIAKRVPQEQNGLRRRAAAPIEEVIKNEVNRGGYFASTQVGTPGQNLTLQLDTGSSDIWVPSPSSSVCQGQTQSSPNGCIFGSFDSSSSSTFNDFDKGGFAISYVDGSSASGDYFRDVFEIGNTSISNVTMGLGRKTDIAYGLVGVGYALNEAVVSQSGTTSNVYENLPLKMVNEGLIATNAYSLWLNDLDAGTGSILFGGIDTAKYEGDLTRIDIIPGPSGKYTSFLVSLTSLSASSSSGSDTLSSSKFPIPVVLDSGTTLSYLPNDIAQQVWHEVGAVYSPDVGVAVIPCNMATSNGTFQFGFAGANGPKISVGMDELVQTLANPAPRFQSGAYKGLPACEFGIQNLTSSTPYLLGDTFLRSAYVVYDLFNNQVAMAKTDFNATGSNIVPFPSKSAQIPSATAAANQVTASAQTGSLTTPTYGASSGFSDGVKNSGSTVPAFDWAQLGVIWATATFMLVGSGLFFL